MNTQSHEPPKDAHAPLFAGTIPQIPLETVIACYRKGEWGDALLFAQVFAGCCVYDHLERAWYLWQGHFWQRDDQGRVRALVSGLLAGLYLRAAAELASQGEGALGTMEHAPVTPENESPAALLKGLTQRAFALRALKRNSHVLAFACTDSRLAFTSERWDRDPWLLGTREGVLDLRDGVLRDGQPTDYIRTVIPTRWQGIETLAPRFEQFLAELFGDREPEERAELIAFLQRVLGYGITGNVSEHLFLLLYGEEGRNGKDTLMHALQAVLGGLVGAVSNDVILSTGKSGMPGAAKPHLCALQGKRIAWASETDRGARFDVTQVKFLTGGGGIPARQLYGKEYVFEPSHLLLLLTNHRPHADARDLAFWERLCPLTFRMRFVERPAGPLERPRDRGLIAALQAEASGILAWLVRGCLAWQKLGLQLPAQVLRERALYQEEEDLLQLFLTECCLLAPEAQVRSSRLFSCYVQWAEANHLSKPLSGVSFGAEMKRRFLQQRDQQGSFYIGLTVRAGAPRNHKEERGV